MSTWQNACERWRKRMARWHADGSLLARFGSDERGSYLIAAALLAPVLAGIAGLGTEYGIWMQRHQVVQSAADSAAISAAVGLSGSNGDALTQASAIAASYGLAIVENTVQVNHPPQDGPYAGATSAVEVVIQQQVPRLFSSLWTSQPLLVAARSTALMPNGGDGCTLAMDPSAAGAITMQGSTQVTLNGCSLFADSKADTALSVGGSASLYADFVGVVGGVSGTSDITSTGGIAVGQAPVLDPYASVAMPSFTGCDHKNYVAKTAVTIDPGVYCGGISLNAGADVTLNPGIYIIDGGSLSVNGGATLSGAAVTLVFTSSSGSNWPTVTINGNATVDLTAPKSGAMTGIVMYGDRNIPLGTSYKLNGGSTQTFGGAIDIPTGAINYAGGANTSAACTQLIGDTINFVGNSNLAANCSQYGTKPIGSPVARLVQ